MQAWHHCANTYPFVPLGHLIFVGCAGFLTPQETERGIRLFATQVLLPVNETASAVAT